MNSYSSKFSHEKLVTEFYNLVKSQEIMLSEKKNDHWVNINRIFGNDPDKLSVAKQIQQFLGIVNYMFDFIPKISKYRNYLTQI